MLPATSLLSHKVTVIVLHLEEGLHISPFPRKNFVCSLEMSVFLLSGHKEFLEGSQISYQTMQTLHTALSCLLCLFKL